MVYDLKRIYDETRTQAYRNADSVYQCMEEGSRYKLADVIGEKLYSIIVFVHKELTPKVSDNCDLAFDCKGNGFSYHIGCYFQNKEYDTTDNIHADIESFKSLLEIYNKDKFPEEVELVNNIIKNLQSFVERCQTYELWKQ